MDKLTNIETFDAKVEATENYLVRMKKWISDRIYYRLAKRVNFLLSQKKSQIFNPDDSPITLDGTVFLILCDTDSGDIIVNISEALNSEDYVYTIKNIGTGEVTVNAASGDLLDDASSETLIQHEVIRIGNDLSNWWIL